MNDQPHQQGPGHVSGRWMAALWSVCFLLALAVVFPGFLVAFDHHGTERIPTHAHPLSVSSPREEHNHAYESAHQHHDASLSDEESVPAIVRSESAAILATGLPTTLAIPLTFAACILAVGLAGALLMSRRGLIDQAAFPPPTPPPPSLAALL